MRYLLASMVNRARHLSVTIITMTHRLKLGKLREDFLLTQPLSRKLDMNWQCFALIFWAKIGPHLGKVLVNLRVDLPLDHRDCFQRSEEVDNQRLPPIAQESSWSPIIESPQEGASILGNHNHEDDVAEDLYVVFAVQEGGYRLVGCNYSVRHALLRPLFSLAPQSRIGELRTFS